MKEFRAMLLSHNRANPVELIDAVFGLLTMEEQASIRNLVPDLDLRTTLAKVALGSRARHSMEKSLRKAEGAVAMIRGGATPFEARNIICDLFIFELLDC